MLSKERDWPVGLPGLMTVNARGKIPLLRYLSYDVSNSFAFYSLLLLLLLLLLFIIYYYLLFIIYYF